jgi:hypothetical protein
MSSAIPKMTRIPDPIIMDFIKLFSGVQTIMGIKAPTAIEIPPILGVGSVWIFLSSGISNIPALRAMLMLMGIIKIVIIAEIINVENRTISLVLSIPIHNGALRL